MTAAARLVWHPDGYRVPYQPPQRPAQSHTGGNRGNLAALPEPSSLHDSRMELIRAINDIEPPDLSAFGATLTPAQEAQYRQWATRRRDWSMML